MDALIEQNRQLKRVVQVQEKRLDRLNFELAIAAQLGNMNENLDELPDLPALFPIPLHEADRLCEVDRLGLFKMPIPNNRIEQRIDDHLSEIQSSFPHIDSVFFTAIGSDTYRVLAARIREDNGNYETRANGIKNTRYAEFGHRSLSACQYTLNEAATICFSEVKVPPMVIMVRRFPKLFEVLAQYDATLQHYISKSMNRKAWSRIMKILTDQPEVISDVKPELATMFELFAYFKNNYIGAPVKYNNHVVGVICFLHNNNSSDEKHWKHWSQIEDLSKELEAILGDLEPEHNQSNTIPVFE